MQSKISVKLNTQIVNNFCAPMLSRFTSSLRNSTRRKKSEPKPVDNGVNDYEYGEAVLGERVSDLHRFTRTLIHEDIPNYRLLMVNGI